LNKSKINLIPNPSLWTYYKKLPTKIKKKELGEMELAIGW